MWDEPAFAATAADGREIYSISGVNRAARALLEGGFPLLWVQGEISNLARPGSGHWYFTLKDAEAQVRCAMFRQRNMLLPFAPENGMAVLVRTRVSLYEGRGEFQLLVEHLEPAGEGALRLAFEALKQRLAAEGLFDAARKKPLPAQPRRVGVITSPTGAALRDILSVLKRRCPRLPVLIYPVPVQGKEAAPKIMAALRLAALRKECDVLILTRGGGSLEDLWAFNEEGIARAIAACPLPIISGIGHEIDFTIADFVADRRAPTPSAAAELVSLDDAEWIDRLAQDRLRLGQRITQQLQHLRQRYRTLATRLQVQHPRRRLHDGAQRLDALELRLQRGAQRSVTARTLHVAAWRARLQTQAPTHKLAALARQLAAVRQRIDRATQHGLEHRTRHLAGLMRALDAVGPLATLARGYAIATRGADGAVLRRASDIAPGGTLHVQLAEGALVCTVDRRR